MTNTTYTTTGRGTLAHAFPIPEWKEAGRVPGHGTKATCCGATFRWDGLPLSTHAVKPHPIFCCTRLNKKEPTP